MIRAFNLQADSEERSESPEDIQLFKDRIQEFWDVVYFSFTSLDSDKLVQTYSAFALPKVLNRWNRIWCPISDSRPELLAWSDYNSFAREAIRRGFRRGVGLLTDFNTSNNIEKWIEYKPDVLDIIPPHLDLIKNEAKNTGQYTLARSRIESLLNDIYSEGQYIPFHPAFDGSFKAKLSQLPLHQIWSFLNEIRSRNHIHDETGDNYLSDLITEVAESAWLSQPSKTDRARAWLTNCECSLHTTVAKEIFSRNEQLVKPIIGEFDPISPFAELLLNYTEEALTELAKEVGLVDTSGIATAAATPQLWCGIIYALRESDKPRILANNSASAKALQQVFRAKVSASTIANGPGKSGSQGDKLRMRVLKLLNK